MILLLLTSTYPAALHVYALENSTHLVVFPLHPLQSALVVFRILSLRSFPLLVLYAVDRPRATPSPAIDEQHPSKAPHPKPVRFLTLAVFWGGRDQQFS